MAKILVAEDDKFLATAYKSKFTKAGFEVVLAQDGVEALEALKTFRPDIILLDLVMPRQDGFVTLEAIKKSESLKAVPVIVASNLGQKEDIERAMKLGAQDFLIKSDTSLESIVAKVNQSVQANKTH